MTGFLRCCWFYVSTDSVCFSRFAICCPCFCLGRFAISHALRYRALAICCQPPASSASGSRNHRTTLYCGNPLRRFRFASSMLRIVRSQPRTASLLSGNSVLRADFFRRRPTSPRQLSVFQRFCAGLTRGEPSAELPTARARRQWFMTEEDGARLRSSLFLENGPAGVCKAVFAEPIAPKSVKFQGRVSLAYL